jgi:hypothetical protein
MGRDKADLPFGRISPWGVIRLGRKGESRLKGLREYNLVQKLIFPQKIDYFLIKDGRISVIK